MVLHFENVFILRGMDTHEYNRLDRARNKITENLTVYIRMHT